MTTLFNIHVVCVVTEIRSCVTVTKKCTVKLFEFMIFTLLKDFPLLKINLKIKILHPNQSKWPGFGLLTFSIKVSIRYRRQIAGTKRLVCPTGRQQMCLSVLSLRQLPKIKPVCVTATKYLL